MRRDQLRQELELQSSGRENKVLRAFATALEMQHNTEEEAVALKSELEWAMHNSKQQMNTLVEEVLCLLTAHFGG